MSPLVALACFIAGLAYLRYYLWIRGGKTERARRRKPRTVNEERLTIECPPAIVCMFCSGLPIAIDQRFVSGNSSPNIFAVCFALTVGIPLAIGFLVFGIMALFYGLFDQLVAVPRWMVPKWMYDEEVGHPFSFKLRGVKRDPNAPEPPLY